MVCRVGWMALGKLTVLVRRQFGLPGLFCRGGLVVAGVGGVSAHGMLGSLDVTGCRVRIDTDDSLERIWFETSFGLFISAVLG